MLFSLTILHSTSSSSGSNSFINKGSCFSCRYVVLGVVIIVVSVVVLLCL